MPPDRLWAFYLSRGKFSGTAFISLGPRSIRLACGVAADGASEIFISPLAPPRSHKLVVILVVFIIYPPGDTVLVIRKRFANVSSISERASFGFNTFTYLILQWLGIKMYLNRLGL